ncbi:MAG: MFS transporter [Candidatus Diapherotrites archaeon]|jgi:MFS family permease|nr:MFS transporter [Candidatus Diapherotrites archaeon]MBT4596912.1 MFS transporter [Candidatus Diapherotrites archaeon]
MTFFHKGELKILWPFYLDVIISRILHFAPAFMIIYFLNLGFSFTQLGLLLAIIPITALIFEIPTGAIADLYGRKFSVLLGYLFEGIGFLILFFVTDFTAIVVAYVVIGIASTLSSGAKEAWVIELLKNKPAELTHNFFSHTQVLESLALIISGILGAIIVSIFNLQIIWLFAFLSFIISIIVLLFSKEHFVKHKKQIKYSIRHQSKKTFNYCCNNHRLRFYLAASFLVALAGAFSSTLTWTPLMKSFNFPDFAFGYLWSALSFVLMIAPLFSKKFLKQNNERKFMIFGLALSALSACIIIFAWTWQIALGLILLLEMFLMMRTPASRMYFHRYLPNNLRATAGSIKAILVAIASAISLVLAGLIIDIVGPTYSLFLFAPIMILAIWFLTRIKKD